MPLPINASKGQVLGRMYVVQGGKLVPIVSARVSGSDPVITGFGTGGFGTGGFGR